MNGFGAERQSSIDNEPRTLNNSQIEYARDVALYVVNTRSNQEALTIFTQGLEPVVRCCEGGLVENIGVEAEQISYDENVNNIRDIVSAPF